MFGLTVVAAVACLGVAQDVRMLPGENWWSVENYYGAAMPFTEKTCLEMDIRKDGHSNQYASLLLSDKGRVIWCEKQVGVLISNGVIRIEGDAPIIPQRLAVSGAASCRAPS